MGTAWEKIPSSTQFKKNMRKAWKNGGKALESEKKRTQFPHNVHVVFLHIFHTLFELVLYIFRTFNDSLYSQYSTGVDFHKNKNLPPRRFEMKYKPFL